MTQVAIFSSSDDQHCFVAEVTITEYSNWDQIHYDLESLYNVDIDTLICIGYRGDIIGNYIAEQMLDLENLVHELKQLNDK